ncbi:MAG: Glutamine--scyllo-inositol transaminase [Gammaproteobacteria bacterium]|jgi:dTDP-4-amino-4,6-dideoxygalactose transaminase|nr:Glutamine--scyllo-inositol transaminase [Gammaproteobacteria bacterium]
MTRWPVYAEDEIQAVEQVLRSGKVNYWTGEQGKLFEKEYAEYLGVKHAVAVANGTNALELCLIALGIGSGDEVIVPCRTFMASASCVVAVGAKPVMCDIDPQTQNLSVETIKPHLTPNTKAIIAVHLGGWPCDMESLMSFAKQHQLYVIEDCAQAHGARIHGKPVGSFGDMAAFSFCQDKIITTMGEGGLVATNDDVLWKKVWAYKDHGKGYDTVYHAEHPPGFRWLHDNFGSNYRMTEAQAAVGRLQLKKLDSWTKARESYANILDSYLQDSAALRIPKPDKTMQHAYYRYYLFVKPERLKEGWSRDRIMAEANAAGVPCFVGSCSEIYLEKAFASRGFAPKARFPHAKQLGETSMVLLVDPHYTEEDIHEFGQKMKAILEKAVL